MGYRRFCYRCNDRRDFAHVSGQTYKCKSCGKQVIHDKNKTDAPWKNDPSQIDSENPRRRMKYED